MTTPAKPEPKARGTFAKTPFAHILVYLLDHSMSGTLEVKGDKHEVICYFQKGTPAKVQSTVAGRTLGAVLQKMGLVNDDQLKAVEERVSEKGELLGQVLIQQGAIDAPSLIRGLRQQILIRLTDVFALTNAQYAFYERVNLLHGIGADELFPLDPLPLIMSGLRKYGSRLQLDTLCESLRGKWISITDENTVRRFKLTESEKDFLEELFEQKYSYDSLLESKRFDADMVKYLLYGMCITRLVKVESTPPVEEKQNEKPAERRASRLVSLDPGPFDVKEAPELADKRQQILNKAAEIAAQNYYEMLELQPSDPPEKARLAFFRLAKLYHPDKIAKELASELKETLQYIFSNLSAAHTTLTDPDSKEEYDGVLQKGSKAESSSEISEEEAQVRDVLEGENLYQKALVYLRRNQDDQAREFVDRALSLNKDNPEHQALQAHLEWKRRPKDSDNSDLLDVLRKSVDAIPKSERAHLYFAHVLKASGRENEAVQHFERVLALNSHNIEAARELRLIKMRKKNTKDKAGSFFSRFLK